MRNIVEGLNISFMFMGEAWETIKQVILDVGNIVEGFKILVSCLWAGLGKQLNKYSWM